MTEQQSSCLISDKRTCNVANQKNTVFVIGSSSPEFEEDVNSVMDVLTELGLTGYFALLSENEKGLDAFCDKICSKIRESEFCIAILNDPTVSKKIEGKTESSERVRVPSANVYYEFGMAVGLGKHVIPVVREGYKLPFDVQHLDSIIYANSSDLKQNLKKVIVAILLKKPKRVTVVNTKIIEVIYGPLYNEISRFLAKKDRFTSFTHPQYGTILSHHRYLLDTIDENLRKEIETFFSEMDEFNRLLQNSQRLITSIVEEQIFQEFGVRTINHKTISIELKTDSSTILPSIEQILIRNTTPERYFETQNVPREINKITYRLTKEDNKTEKIPEHVFQPFFEKCREIVESNQKIARLRGLNIDLLGKAEALKVKLGYLCQ